MLVNDKTASVNHPTSRFYSLCSQRRPPIVKYGQVSQEAATLTKPAIMVSAVTNHHHTFKLRNREISLRKKNRKAILTEKITSHHRFVAAFSSFDILGISPSSRNTISPSKP